MGQDTRFWLEGERQSKAEKLPKVEAAAWRVVMCYRNLRRTPTTTDESSLGTLIEELAQTLGPE